MTPEEIKDKYEERIKALLNNAAELLRAEGLTAGEPDDMHDDQFSWWLQVEQGDHETVDVKFEILESEQYDGEENGVNFGVDVTSYEGRMIGGLIPYNYTPQVWVDRDDADAVEERFNLIMQADLGELVHLITRFFNEE